MYRVFLHPNRQGNGPAFWGFSENGSSCDIFYGKLEGPFTTKAMAPGYSARKIKEKLGKGYIEVGSMPDDQMPTFFNLVRKTRSQAEWEHLPIRTLHPDVASALRNVRTAIGKSSMHPDDSRTDPVNPPPHRRPRKLKIKAEKLAWMF